MNGTGMAGPNGARSARRPERVAIGSPESVR